MLLSDISDHLPLLTVIKNAKIPTEQSMIRYRNYRKISDDHLVAHSNTKFVQLTNIYASRPELTLNDKFDFLNNTLTGIINDCFPLHKLSRREKRLQLRPWITSGILKSIKTRNRFYKNLIKCNFKDKELHNFYKNFRNKLTKVKQLSKKNYFEGLLKECKGNTKKKLGYNK